MTSNRDIVNGIIDRVDVTDNLEDCWPWVGSIDSRGNPKYQNRRPQHHYAELVLGISTRGRWLDTTCGSGLCMNVTHWVFRRAKPSDLAIRRAIEVNRARKKIRTTWDGSRRKLGASKLECRDCGARVWGNNKTGRCLSCHREARNMYDRMDMDGDSKSRREGYREAARRRRETGIL